MTLEMGSNAGLTVTLVALFAAIVLTVVACLVHDYYTVCVYTSHGYTRTTLPGASCVYWVKEAK